MAYEEQDAKRSRVVVETPTTRREYVQSESTRTPERGGISGGTVGVIVVLAVALVTILVLLLLSGQSSETPSDLATQQPAPVPQTTIIQQPAQQQQPPIIIQQPATQPAPVIVTQPAPAGAATDNDSTIQVEVDKILANDSSLADKGITATVDSGKVMLVGTVQSEAQKAQAERIVLRIKGVTAVDNQIAVIP